MVSLQKLSLSLSDCGALDDISGFQALTNLPHLQEFEKTVKQTQNHMSFSTTSANQTSWMREKITQKHKTRKRNHD